MSNYTKHTASNETVECIPITNDGKTDDAVVVVSETTSGPDKDETAVWIPTKVDLVLSVLITCLLPLINMYLFNACGALFPIILYYGCCWALVYWRQHQFVTRPYHTYTFGLHYNYQYFKDTYFNFESRSKILLSLLLLFNVVLSTLRNYAQSLLSIPENDKYWYLTMVFWAPTNGISENLLWFYIMDSFWNYKVQSKVVHFLFIFIGIILMLAYVGLIHALFWGHFHYDKDDFPKEWALFADVAMPVALLCWVILWKTTNDMTMVAVFHMILNVGGVYYAKYSMDSYMFTC
eukprot:89275_1